MSKDTPEVGDVFKDKFKNRMFVYYTDKVTTSFYIKFRNVIEKYTVLTREFIQTFTYLGKSKANIDDLFETENEE